MKAFARLLNRGWTLSVRRPVARESGILIPHKFVVKLEQGQGDDKEEYACHIQHVRELEETIEELSVDIMTRKYDELSCDPSPEEGLSP